MSRLEDLQPSAAVRGLPDALATVVSVQWFGSEALELTGCRAHELPGIGSGGLR
jgi:hypothetical protein